MLHHGDIVADGPIQELKGATRQAFELRVKGDLSRFTAALESAGAECHGTEEDVMRVLIDERMDARDLFALAASHHVQVRHLRPSVPTLEDVFARAVGEE